MYNPLSSDCFFSTRPDPPSNPVHFPSGPTDAPDIRIECPAPCFLANGLPNCAQQSFTRSVIQKIKQRSDGGLSVYYTWLPEHEYGSIYDFAPQVPRKIILLAPHLQELAFWPQTICPTCSRAGVLRFEQWKPNTHLAFDIDDCFYVLSCSYKCTHCRSTVSATSIVHHLPAPIQVALNRHIFVINKDTIVSAALYHLINLELTAHFNVNQLHGRLMRGYNATFITHQSYHASLTALKTRGQAQYSLSASSRLTESLLTSFDLHCGYNGRYLSCHRISEVYRHDHHRSDEIIRSLMSHIVDDTFKSDAVASVAANIGLRGSDVGSSNNQQPFNTLYVTATSTGLVADYHLLPTQDLTYQMACTFINIGPRLARLSQEWHSTPITWGFDTCCVNKTSFKHFWGLFHLPNPYALMGDGDHYLRRIIEKYGSDAPHRNNFVHNLKLRMFGSPGSALKSGVHIAEKIKTYASEARTFLDQNHPNRVSKEVWLAVNEQCNHFTKGCFVDPPLPFSQDRFGQIGLRRGTFALENIFFHLQKAAFRSFVSLDTALTFLAKFFFQWNLDRIAQYSKTTSFRAFPSSCASIMAISVSSIAQVRSCSLVDACKLSDMPVVAAMFDQSESQQFGSTPLLAEQLKQLSQSFVHPNPTKRIPVPPPIDNSILEFIVEESESATTREHETFSQLSRLFDDVPLEDLLQTSALPIPQDASSPVDSSDQDVSSDDQIFEKNAAQHQKTKRRRRGDLKGTGKHKSKAHKVPPPQVSGINGTLQRTARAESSIIANLPPRALPCLPYGRDFFPIEIHLLRYLAQRIRHVKPASKGRGRNISQQMTPDWQGIHRVYIYFAEWSFSQECTHPWIKRQIRGKTQDILKQRYLLSNLNLEAFPGVPLRSGPPLHPNPDAGLTPHQLLGHFSKLSAHFASLPTPSSASIEEVEVPPSLSPLSSSVDHVISTPISPLPEKKRARFGTQCYDFLKRLDALLPTPTLLGQWQQNFPEEYRTWEAKHLRLPHKRMTSEDSLNHHFRALLRKIRPIRTIFPLPSTSPPPTVPDETDSRSSSPDVLPVSDARFRFYSLPSPTKTHSYMHILQPIPEFLTLAHLEAYYTQQPTSLPSLPMRPPGQRGLTASEKQLLDYIIQAPSWKSVNLRHRWIEAEQLWRVLGSMKNKTSNIPMIYSKTGKQLYELHRQI